MTLVELLGKKVGQDWKRFAACRNKPTSMFYPIGTKGESVNEISAAKAVCDKCLVKDECLAYAFQTEPKAGDVRNGIFGGMTEAERHTLYRRVRRGTRVSQ
jgi:WhiB family transcriptional regulator, redox-sensing transcriptional regulator